MEKAGRGILLASYTEICHLNIRHDTCVQAANLTVILMVLTNEQHNEQVNHCCIAVNACYQSKLCVWPTPEIVSLEMLSTLPSLHFHGKQRDLSQ